MAREWEAKFIRLWNDGASTEQIAAALEIPPGTASSRANALQREGKITPRSKGGWHARMRTDQAPAGTPAHHPRVNIKQWTVRLSQALIDAVKAQAAAEGKEPGYVVEDVLWSALIDRRSSKS
jgi:hypothetical protein